MARSTLDVKHRKATGEWELSAPGRSFGTYATKVKAVTAGRRQAQKMQPSSLRIRGRDGRIQEERTYPRSSDPRRSRG